MGIDFPDNDLEEVNESKNVGEPNKALCFFLFFIVGNFNNASYVVVTTAATDIAHRFHQESLVGMFLLSLWFFSVALKILNSTLWIKLSHSFRFNVTNVLFVISFVLISYTYTIPDDQVWGFWLALFATLIMGIASSFGESVMLGKKIKLLINFDRIFKGIPTRLRFWIQCWNWNGRYLWNAILYFDVKIEKRL